MADTEVEVLAPSAVEALNRSEIQSQIEVAKRYPRSMQQFKTRACEMACVDEETAASCIYRRPVGKEGTSMKFAEGMSVRMAEIVGASYGNLRVYATVIDQTERQVIARGMAIDLESNFASSSEVIESTVDKHGKPYSERQRALVAKVACSKARRDATFQVVPKALAKPVEVSVRKLLLGEAKSLDTRRQQVSGWIKTLNINEDRVYAALGVKGIAEVGFGELETLTGLRTAIKDGDTSIDEAFPPIEIAAPKAKHPEPKNKEKANADQPRGESSDIAATGATGGESGGLDSGEVEHPRATEGAKPDEKPAEEKKTSPAKEAKQKASVQGDGSSQLSAKESRGDAVVQELHDWIKNAPIEELQANTNKFTQSFNKIPEDQRINLLRDYDERRKGNG